MANSLNKKPAPKKSTPKKVVETAKNIEPVTPVEVVEEVEQVEKVEVVEVVEEVPQVEKVEEVEQVEKVEEIEEVEEVEEVPEASKYDDLMKPYLKAYPDNKKFFISSDGQVFLEKNKQFAVDHQKTIDANTEVGVYESK